MAYSERRDRSPAKLPATTFYTEQRRTEYKPTQVSGTSATVSQEEYVTPEEATQLFEQNLSQAEEEARRQAAEEIQKQKEEAYQKYLQELEAKKQQYAEIYRKQQEERIKSDIAKLKRQASYYPSPREFAKAKEKEMAKFEADLQKAIAEWEAQEKERAEQEIAAWEQQAWSEIEQQIQQQREQAKQEFETELSKAIVQVPEQAPSIAERILELPSLNLWQYFGLPKIPELIPMQKQEVVSRAFVSGFVGSLESIIYGVSDLAGFLLQGLGDVSGLYKFEYSPLWHPQYPPTVSGALLTSGIESALAFQLKPSAEMQQLGKFQEKYGTPATIMYGTGSIFGDIFAIYVGGKAFEYGKKAVSKVASEVSEAVGWKYSHLHYVLHEKKLAILEQLPKSPLTSLKQSHLAYELYRLKSDVAHAILPTKYMKYPAREIVSLPTVISGEKLPASWVKIAPQLGEATSGAWMLAATPKAAGYGFTAAYSPFVRTISKSAIKELILGSPLAFVKIPYRMERAGELFFEKEKLPSLKDLLKEEKGSAVLVSPLEIGKKAIEKSFAFGETLLKPRISKESFPSFALIMGLKAYPKPYPFSDIKAKIRVSQVVGLKAKVSPIQAVSPKYALRQLQVLRMRQLGKTAYAPRLPFKIVRKKVLVRKPSLDVFGAEVGIWQYPVASPKQAVKVLILPKKTIGRGKRK